MIHLIWWMIYIYIYKLNNWWHRSLKVGESIQDAKYWRVCCEPLFWINILILTVLIQCVVLAVQVIALSLLCSIVLRKLNSFHYISLGMFFILCISKYWWCSRPFSCCNTVKKRPRFAQLCEDNKNIYYASCL